EAWRSFLLLLGRSPEDVRAGGGIASIWSTSGVPSASAAGFSRHVEITEIDYAEVLRERAAGAAALWERVVASCLQGGASSLDDEATGELLAAAMDADRLRALLSAVETRLEGRDDRDEIEGTTQSGVRDDLTTSVKAAALLKALRRVRDVVS